jgi:hypothetical protein
MVTANQFFLHRAFGISVVAVARNIWQFYQKPFKG